MSQFKKKNTKLKKTILNIGKYYTTTSNILYSDNLGYKIQLRLFPKIDLLEFVKKYIVQHIFSEI
jgi:hypothetical protein